MAIDFPNSPSVNDQHTAAGVTWKWDGTTWLAQGGTSSYSLPIAGTGSGGTLGGIKVGTGLAITTGILSSGVTIQEEGTPLATVATTLNFVGSNVTASGTTGTKTITIAGATTAEPVITWVLGANGSSDYTFTGSGFTGAVNDPTLYLIRGQTYKFENNTGGHPFRIQSTVAASGGGTQYNSGVTNNDATGASNQTLTFVVPMDAPDILYYQCTAHPGMTGTIHILNQQSTGITVQEEGSTLATAGTTLNFVGAGVTASGTGATKTITLAPALDGRSTFTATTASLANNVAGNIEVTAHKSYSLLKIKPSIAAWVTLYVDAASRTADANRVQGADPAPDAGVIAEVITTAANQEIKMSPAVLGWHQDAGNDGVPTVFCKVVNKSGSTGTCTVSLTVVQLEA